MERHRIYARHLDAVETLGNIDVICFDKTGTLTLNQMAVKELRLSERTLSAEDFTSRKVKGHPDQDSALSCFLQSIVLCNEAGPEKRAGSSTELALLDLAAGAGIDIEGLRSKYPTLRTIHRNEGVAMMTTIHELGGGQGQLVCAKGNPNEVLNRCTQVFKGGKIVPLDDLERKKALLANETMASNALRV